MSNRSMVGPHHVKKFWVGRTSATNFRKIWQVILRSGVASLRERESLQENAARIGDDNRIQVSHVVLQCAPIIAMLNQN